MCSYLVQPCKALNKLYTLPFLTSKLCTHTIKLKETWKRSEKLREIHQIVYYRNATIINHYRIATL